MSDNKQFDRSKCFTFFNTYRIQGKRIREKYGDKMAADYYEAIIDYGLDQKPIIDTIVPINQDNTDISGSNPGDAA